MSFLFGRQRQVVYTYRLQACRVCRCRNASEEEAVNLGLMQTLPIEAVYQPVYSPTSYTPRGAPLAQRRPYGYRQPYGYRFYDGTTSAYTYRGRRTRPFY